MKNVFLAIDSSNYTTSAAVCDLDGNVLLNFKRLLPVKDGERGLRQSDAVFHHVEAFPDAAQDVRAVLAVNRLCAVGVSSKPRDIEGSYMPCFLAGIASAEFAATACNAPLYHFSHQAGHIMAAAASACRNSRADVGRLIGGKFLAFHVSGGTTDLLLVRPDEERIFDITQIGGSRDLNAGQAIDRTGVKMGLRFPCGAEMDKSAIEYGQTIRSENVSVDGTWCNLSGLENKAENFYKKSGNAAETSAFVLSFIADTLEKMAINAREVYGDLPIVFAGGVMSSEYIRSRLSGYGMFSSPEFSSDNAAGTALLTAEMYRRNNNIN